MNFDEPVVVLTIAGKKFIVEMTYGKALELAASKKMVFTPVGEIDNTVCGRIHTKHDGYENEANVRTSPLPPNPSVSVALKV